jgi:hypothetical protein
MLMVEGDLVKRSDGGTSVPTRGVVWTLLLFSGLGGSLYVRTHKPLYSPLYHS